jgi:alanine dehydrogenase
VKIGCPKEIKIHEYRVGLVPAGVRELTSAGHAVVVETGAGSGIGISDDAYKAAGATVLPDAASVFAAAEMIVKVKEPQLPECSQLRRGQVLFTYLHLAADAEQAKALAKSGVTAIAYETVALPDRSLPLLTPMSEVAGRMSIQVGATALQKANGGFGVLLGGVPGVAPARVVILGGGVAGTNATQMAVGLGAQVTVVDRSLRRLRELDAQFGSQIETAYLGRWAMSGMMFVSLFFAAALGWIWWLIDLVRMPEMVREHNHRVAFEILQTLTAPADPTPLAGA